MMSSLLASAGTSVALQAPPVFLFAMASICLSTTHYCVLTIPLISIHCHLADIRVSKMTAAPGGSPPMSIYSTPSPSAPEVSHFTSDADSAGHNLKPARSYGRLTQLISGNGARARSRSSSIGSQGAGSGIADEGMTRTRSKENHVQITSRPVSRSEARKSGRGESAGQLGLSVDHTS